MSLRDCTARAVDGGLMDPTRADEANKLFDQLAADAMQRGMASDAAERYAAQHTLNRLRFEKAEAKRRMLLTQQAVRGRELDITTYRNAAGKPDRAAGLRALAAQDELAGFSSIELRRQEVLGAIHKRMVPLLHGLRRTIGGFNRNPERMRNVIREAFGESTNDQAGKVIAQAWAEASEYARLRRNQAGGRTPKRKDWGLPQWHDTLLVRKVTDQEWIDFTLPLLNPAKMYSELTGELIDPSQLPEMLRGVHRSIATEGFIDFTPRTFAGSKPLANRHIDPRFLAFKDADSWMRYQERFGEGDPFTIMMGHTDLMAREIAQMEVLGPNPRATLSYLEGFVTKDAALQDAADGGVRNMDHAKSMIRQTRDVLSVFNGTNNAPINSRIARGFAGLRQALTAAQLGAASLAALPTDFGFQRLAARMSGIPMSRIVMRYAKLMNPASSADRQLAVRLGLIAEEWSHIASAQQRFFGEVQGTKIMGWFADNVMRWSLLSPHTQAGKWAFGMEFMGTLADHAGKGFDQLPKPLRGTLERYGIDGTRWDRMRAAPIYDHQGAKFMRPDEMEAAGNAGDATRLMEMIAGETQYAVPSASLRGRAAMISSNQPGTFTGEMLRSAAMYKNFGVTLLLTHGRRALIRGRQDHGAYFANLFLTSAVLGALGMQMREIAKGKEPRPMFGDLKTTAAFWGSAVLAGGGFGIFGDFLNAATARTGQGFAETLAGPVVGFATDLAGLTAGNVVDAVRGRDMNLASDLVRFTKRYLPGSSLWYARLALEREVFDRLEIWGDPAAAGRLREAERRQKREYGNGYWWSPGTSAFGR